MWRLNIFVADVIEPTYFETIVEVGGKYYHSDLSKPKVRKKNIMRLRKTSRICYV